MAAWLSTGNIDGRRIALKQVVAARMCSLVVAGNGPIEWIDSPALWGQFALVSYTRLKHSGKQYLLRHKRAEYFRLENCCTGRFFMIGNWAILLG